LGSVESIHIQPTTTSAEPPTKWLQNSDEETSEGTFSAVSAIIFKEEEEARRGNKLVVTRVATELDEIFVNFINVNTVMCSY